MVSGRYGLPDRDRQRYHPISAKERHRPWYDAAMDELRKLDSPRVGENDQPKSR